ncbi:sodium:solute symporter family transporter [Pseudoflavonifractor phocaeensis]|uniref:sodium:solute symporter family transporter n=1 Tax=Pseudoflavonifractor phocaeensis TaxID=1870988 RepID=UPI0019582C84|nr:hypothetical protein [Pseudoflavonifractor phocaeensis]MBM6871250.1 hypothetical protein [Pseudoflavonifractor phocaeensis]
MANDSMASGTIHLKGRWIKGVLTDFYPVLEMWKFYGAYGLHARQKPTLQNRTVEFTGYGRWSFSGTLSDFDSWTRSWLNSKEDAAVVGLISAAIICATMSSADSNLLCMSTMVMNDLYLGLGGKKDLSEKQIVFYTRLCNVLAAAVAIAISMAGISIVTMNTFAFGIRCAGPFAAYGLGLVVPKATRHSGIISLFAGTIGFCFWQWLSGGDFYLGILPVVFGCAVSVVVFFLVNLVEWKMGVEAAPSAYEEAKQ